MKILIVSATRAEIEPFINEFFPGGSASQPARGAPVQILITGVGAPATVYHLTRELQRTSYDMIINAGIAGSFDQGLPLGSVLQVLSDGFADLGAEDGPDFLDIFQLGLAGADTPPFKGGRLQNAFRESGLPLAAGITVNTVHGDPSSIEAIRSRCAADGIAGQVPLLESMEGAAFFYVCMSEGTRCLQLRAVSNYVEKRNRENWNIPLAVRNLNVAILQLVKKHV